MSFHMLNYLPLVLSYLVGCFPSGILIAAALKTDIRSQGSGNVGATNVARVAGKKAGIATLLLDIAKGYLGAALPFILVNAGLLQIPTPGTTLPPHSELSLELITLLSGLMTVLGHCFSLPGLRGGKGIATSLGVLMAIAPYQVVLITLTSFIVVFILTRIVSCGSLAAAASLPVAASIFCPGSGTLILGLITLTVWYRHKENIGRILRGEEKKFKASS